MTVIHCYGVIKHYVLNNGVGGISSAIDFLMEFLSWTGCGLLNTNPLPAAGPELAGFICNMMGSVGTVWTAPWLTGWRRGRAGGGGSGVGERVGVITDNGVTGRS